MSKSMDAIHKAEMERKAASGNGSAPRTKDSETAPHGWTAERRSVPDTVDQQGGGAHGLPDVPPVGTPLTPPRSRPVNEISTAVQGSAGAASPASWEQGIERVKQQLQEVEQQLARQTGDQVRLGAHSAALDQQLVALEQERAAEHQRLEQATQTAAALEASKKTMNRQLDALRECQMLAHSIRTAEQDAQANAEMIAHLTQSQQRTADELAQYQERSDTLQKQMDHLRFRLGKALVLTGTTERSS